MNETLDEYYDLFEVYRDLDLYDQEMIWSIYKLSRRQVKSEKRTVSIQKRVDGDVEHSDLR